MNDEFTGSHDFTKTKVITYDFAHYEIEVKITEDNKFVGIVGIKVNKDFRTHSQMISSTDVVDVEEFYKDE